MNVKRDVNNHKENSFTIIKYLEFFIYIITFPQKYN